MFFLFEIFLKTMNDKNLLNHTQRDQVENTLKIIIDETNGTCSLFQAIKHGLQVVLHHALPEQKELQKAAYHFCL